MGFGPFRGMAWGGVAFGAVVLVIGIVLLLANQGIINIVFDFVTVCSIGLIVFGIVALVGALWAQRMMRGGWRRWMDWEEKET